MISKLKIKSYYELHYRNYPTTLYIAWMSYHLRSKFDQQSGGMPAHVLDGARAAVVGRRALVHQRREDLVQHAGQ